MSAVVGNNLNFPWGNTVVTGEDVADVSRQTHRPITSSTPVPGRHALDVLDLSAAGTMLTINASVVRGMVDVADAARGIGNVLHGLREETVKLDTAYRCVTLDLGAARALVPLGLVGNCLTVVDATGNGYIRINSPTADPIPFGPTIMVEIDGLMIHEVYLSNQIQAGMELVLYVGNPA